MPQLQILVSTQWVAHAPRVPFDAPRVEHLSPGIRDEASRTTREGACAPHHQTQAALIHCSPCRLGWLQLPVKKTGQVALNRIPVEARITDAKRASALECGGTTPLSPDATRRVIPKRGHVRALQNEFTTAEVYTFERELG